MTATALSVPAKREEALGPAIDSMRPRLTKNAMFVGAVALIVIIVALDWITAGVVVGVLLSVPITALSLVDNRRHVVIATVLAATGFVVAMQFGVPSSIPDAVKFPNRALAFLTIPASCYLALRLQALRVRAERARDTAISARDMNRLLTSLLAHDLRAPLILATQALEYVNGRVTLGAPIDQTLLSETWVRIQRNLRSIELVLGGARHAAESAAPEPIRIRQAIDEEVQSFATDAALRSKTLVTAHDALGDAAYLVDWMVLRQSLTILIDNALRYAAPGPVCIEGNFDGTQLLLRVSDSGPASGDAARLSVDPEGSGLGLQLCRSLVATAGGSLNVERSGTKGTSFLLCLPAERSTSEHDYS